MQQVPHVSAFFIPTDNYACSSLPTMTSKVNQNPEQRGNRRNISRDVTRDNATHIPAPNVPISPAMHFAKMGSVHNKGVTRCVTPIVTKGCVALPRQVEGDEEILLHPSLVGALDFDVSRKVFEPYPGCWDEAATFPVLPSLAILIPGIPWALVVHQSSVGVTVKEVLQGIYETLQLPLDNGRETRLSLLRGKHRFMGLSTSSLGDETFLLHLQ